MSDYHARIMNIPANGKEMDSTAYRLGHRDARHAAAEIALEAEAEVERLRGQYRTGVAVAARLLNQSRASDKGKGEDLYMVGKVNGALEVLYAMGSDGNDVIDLAHANREAIAEEVGEEE